MRSEASTATTILLFSHHGNSDLMVVMFCVSMPVVSEQNVEMYDTITFAEARKLSRRCVTIIRETDNIT